jgi:hypothetical protein
MSIIRELHTRLSRLTWRDCESGRMEPPPDAHCGSWFHELLVTLWSLKNQELVGIRSDRRASPHSLSKVALTFAAQQWCGAFLTICVGIRSMDDAVDRVMASYENFPALERLGRSEIRAKIS